MDIGAMDQSKDSRGFFLHREVKVLGTATGLLIGLVLGIIGG
ncbi:hypothetical protein DU19_0155 [Chlamydia muridarum]|nr:hypothetical protein DU17_0155 [Chlamydia muridarum]KDU81128.1 hypothetical protein DU18_0156 [Chlamydia muridarum]KDU82829.1 hypothetical protein DU19_0155 [Chlamydia muridarum]KDU83080.1 hypothetical protein DU20_0155 [Chlamydia muridarum]KDU84006.1 hypothetical protein DU21_0155 [Chlamydia muridarum]